MNEQGLYRVNGGANDVKILKEKFLKGKGAPNLSEVDVATICSTLKDFLRLIFFSSEKMLHFFSEFLIFFFFAEHYENL